MDTETPLALSIWADYVFNDAKGEKSAVTYLNTFKGLLEKHLQKTDPKDNYCIHFWSPCEGGKPSMSYNCIYDIPAGVVRNYITVEIPFNDLGLIIELLPEAKSPPKKIEKSYAIVRGEPRKIMCVLLYSNFCISVLLDDLEQLKLDDPELFMQYFEPINLSKDDAWPRI